LYDYIKGFAVILGINLLAFWCNNKVGNGKGGSGGSGGGAFMKGGNSRGQMAMGGFRS
jgi:hypothetical protein